MAGPWIDAASALGLVARSSGQTGGAHALCARAHAGLVKTRARLLVHEERRAENVELPPTFWWAEGHEALGQHWPTGDFTTWMDGRNEYRAFGVAFDLEGLLQMLPFEERASAARGFSVAGDPTWMPAREASQLAWTTTGAMRPRRLILEQARLGLMAGRAVLAQRFKHRSASAPVWEEREWTIPDWFWSASLRMDEINQDWDLGQFSAEMPASEGSGWITLSGVHFLAESVHALAPAARETITPAPADEARSEAAPKPKGGGRPAQPWWDDLWCAVWGLIHQGDFEPKTQADAERAMLTWAAMNEHELSETAVKPKARKLFHAYKNEVTNFLAP